MNLQGQRDLLLLSEVERDAHVTQRSLASKLGVALGLTNLYLKRLAHKGYIKISTIPPHRIRYLLTPQGMAEKSRLTYQYMQYSITHYRDMRTRLRGTLTDAIGDGVARVVIYGTGELAEMAYLSLKEMNLTLVGFIDDKGQDKFLSYPVCAPDLVGRWDFDAVLLTDLENGEKHREILGRYLEPEKKILTLSLVA
ncbi:MAG TPA: winged helix-turn-helix transcriptional regulator [Nitrospiraceae bacterium]|nr:winged helix-turn-helix transcriptional regulator [Nitrospiraceae bacterium]